MPSRDAFLDLYAIASFKDAWVVDVWNGAVGDQGLLDNLMIGSWRR